MFQKEVANRIIAKSNTREYGRISILSSWKCKITKVKEDGSRSWKSASENIWYKYDLKDNQEFAYSIKPTMSYIYLYQKDADRRKTDKKLKEIAKELKKIGYLAHPSRSSAGYMEYVGPYFQGKR